MSQVPGHLLSSKTLGSVLIPSYLVLFPVCYYPPAGLEWDLHPLVGFIVLWKRFSMASFTHPPISSYYHYATFIMLIS